MEHITILGWSTCAELVIQRFVEHGTMVPDSQLTILALDPPTLDCCRVRTLTGDLSDPTLLAQIDWLAQELVIIFHETTCADAPEQDDVRTLAAVLSIPKTGRIIVELACEDHANIVRDSCGDTAEIILKEKMDACLIANTLVNAGRTTAMLQEAADLQGSRTVLVSASEFLPAGTHTVRELRSAILATDVPRTFLGLLRENEATPQLNPIRQTAVTSNDGVYLVARADDPLATAL